MKVRVNRRKGGYLLTLLDDIRTEKELTFLTKFIFVDNHQSGPVKMAKLKKKHILVNINHSTNFLLFVFFSEQRRLFVVFLLLEAAH